MKISIQNNKPCILEYDILVAQSVMVYIAEFVFDTEWDGYTITAVFENGDQRYEQPLLDGDSCIIPWEVLEKPGHLYISAYGIKSDQRRVSTVSESLIIRSGAEPGENPKEPTPDQYEQILNAFNGKQDKLTGFPGQVVGFDENGDAVAQDAPSGGGDGSYVLPAATKQRLGGVIIGDNLTVDSRGRISVDVADVAEQDNTKPITSAAVHTQIGNIEVLLSTI